ncbi:acetyl-CoA synthetase-like protein [Cladochytrium replicatum]|nr:acetyl-CoA synthetase-like protein [Cladochytrium replicatum]
MDNYNRSPNYYPIDENNQSSAGYSNQSQQPQRSNSAPRSNRSGNRPRAPPMSNMARQFSPPSYSRDPPAYPPSYPPTQQHQQQQQRQSMFGYQQSQGYLQPPSYNADNRRPSASLSIHRTSMARPQSMAYTMAPANNTRNSMRVEPTTALNEAGLARLNSTAKHENTHPGAVVARTLKFSSLVDLLSGTNHPAILEPTIDNQDMPVTIHRKPLYHVMLKNFVYNAPGMMGAVRIYRKDRVAIVVPEGPELASSLILVLSTCTAVPMNPSSTKDEIIHEVVSLKCRALIATSKLTEQYPELGDELRRHSIQLLILQPDPAVSGLFTLEPQFPEPAAHSQHKFLDIHNGPEDIALILRTSGTSGNKKTVPYTLRTLVVGAVCVARSWDLKPNDVNLNMMPLYHVGGIVRNLLAPMLSSGSVIVTSGFDSSVFWDLLDSSALPPTWYYAVPTMHQAILLEGRERYPSGIARNTGIRMICNAGGGLLPSLAVDLRTFFVGSCVLPSYGMTECMPISTPPIGYALERPGTSGVSVGPEIAIFGGDDKPVQSGTIGNIVVRGEPLFHGYEGDAEANKKAFTADGWFNTGDMGYLDQDGYLFITGRSKEVINRGGEIISPVEVEDAVLAHPRVRYCLAFVVPHDVLQETIGMVIVQEEGTRRLDLSELQTFAAKTLHPSKWPQLIVFMNDLPKNQANKPLRINLAKRFGIVELTDSVMPHKRLYEAPRCPPRTATVNDPIPCYPIVANPESSLQCIRMIPEVQDVVVGAGLLKSYPDQLIALVQLFPGSTLTAVDIGRFVGERVHDYDVPVKMLVVDLIPRYKNGQVDLQTLEGSLAKPGVGAAGGKQGRSEKAVADVFRDVLGLKPEFMIGADSDFFMLGGNSMSAGRVISKLRKVAQVDLKPSVLFKYRTVEAIAGLIVDSMADGDDGDAHQSGSPDYEPPPRLAQSSTSFAALWIQILPIALFRPLRSLIYWSLMANLLAFLHSLVFMFAAVPETAYYPTNLKFFELLAAVLLVTLFFVKLMMPFIGIGAKWLIIGRYRAGRFPLWGSYYLRWWLADQIIKLCGRGIFSTNSRMMSMYLRLMGARIGQNSRFDRSTVIGEYDLVEIGDDCAFDASRVRPFAMENGCMVLTPIYISDRVIVNLSTVIAPGADIPPDTAFPPLSSSYELRDCHPSYQALCRVLLPAPGLFMQMFVGYPLIILVNLVSMVPWGAALYLLGVVGSDGDRYTTNFPSIVVYFAQTDRIALKVLAAVAREVVSPFVYMAMVLFVKRAVLGLAKPGENSSQWALTRRFVMKELLGDGSLGGVYGLLGKHYEFTSMFYRALGARCGKRIYWPGTGLFLYEHELFSVGDDVVFGSRTYVVPTDLDGSAHISIDAGAMVADRCVLLPGSHIGRTTVLGSGGLAKRDTGYPDGSVWLGSKNGGAVLWDAGNPVEARRMDTLMPFGRAFYQRKAKYFVYPMWFCAFYTIVLSAIFAAMKAMPFVGAIQASAYVFRTFGNNVIRNPDNKNFGLAEGIGYATLAGSYIVLYWSWVTISLVLEIIAKWTLHGRRQVGQYNWDESSYCQRWQILIVFQHARHDFLDLVRGSWYIVAFFRMLGAKIGKRVCLYPTGGDPMMTEPDLVTIHDDACVDRASVICHINSKGQFSLNPLVLGAGSVLRANSRLLSGAETEEDAILLEHTLILSGDVAGTGLWQGWPADQLASTGSFNSGGGGGFGSELEDAVVYRMATRQRKRRRVKGKMFGLFQSRRRDRGSAGM